ncbi:unnamed protein product [Cuscuta campestris]|uniref:CAAX prenyl protease 2/Lysostaphin resistance protein A-like domain-containing protein n=1 Tax=Cuscuta campestris TaxID=132261 RepID=A0A484MYZ3_9ASTE|nr:unnamed protein product [Cuscuta campestris]
MNLLTAHSCWRSIPSAFPRIADSPPRPSSCYSLGFIPNLLCSRNSGFDVRALPKKLRRKGLKRNEDYTKDGNSSISYGGAEVEEFQKAPSRRSVLRACTVTSGYIGILGLLIRQASHFASIGGLPIADCAAEISWGLQLWHLELIFGMVILVSSCRYLLLKTWPDFAESSEAANRQVLTSLEPYDYIVVSFLPGISEEYLFRCALLPLFGVNLPSALAVAVVFGILHLGSGRNYSFSTWATFVGLVYGYATIATSSIVVPMAAHALNNLVGSIIWKATSSHSR